MAGTAMRPETVYFYGNLLEYDQHAYPNNLLIGYNMLLWEDIQTAGICRNKLWKEVDVFSLSPFT